MSLDRNSRVDANEYDCEETLVSVPLDHCEEKKNPQSLPMWQSYADTFMRTRATQLIAVAILVTCVALTSAAVVLTLSHILCDGKNAANVDADTGLRVVTVGPFDVSSCEDASKQGLHIFDGICNASCWSDMSAFNFALTFVVPRNSLHHTVLVQSQGLMQLTGFREQCEHDRIGSGHVLLKWLTLGPLPNGVLPPPGQSSQMTTYPMPFDEPRPVLVYVLSDGVFAMMVPTDLAQRNNGAMFVASFSSSYPHVSV